jgi:hypothetical protein
MTLQAQPALNAVFTGAQGITYVVTDASGPYQVEVQGINSASVYPNQTTPLITNPTIPATVSDGTYIYTVAGIQDKAFSGNSNLSGTLTVDCSGAIGDSAFFNTHLSGALTIPVTISSIGAGAFRNCITLSSLLLTDYSGSIGVSAFQGSGLTGELTIPYGVNDIGNYAFATTHLTGLTLNNSGKIGNYAFYNCIQLSSELVIPESVAGIGSHAFFNCTSLTSVDLSNYTDSIGASAFQGTALTGELIIPTGVTDIGASAFYGLPLTGLTLNNSGSIGYAAFSATDLADTLTIAASVTDIGDHAFHNCPQLTALDFADYTGNIGNNAFQNTGLTDTLTIPAGVTGIGENAFTGCAGLTSVDFTAYTGASIGNWAFSLCISLNSLTFVRATAPTVGVNTFTGVAPVGTLVYPADADYSALRSALPAGWITSGSDFSDTGSGITYVITSVSPNEAKVKGGVSPNRTLTLADPVIPATVTIIGNEYNVTGIETGAFSGNTGLTGTLTIQCEGSIGNNAFSGCSGLSGTLTVPATVTGLGSWAFSGCSGFTVLNLNSSGGIGGGAFDSCSGLVSADLSTFSGSIGNNAFYGCTALEGSITIPATVTTIGDYAFYLTGLEELVLQSVGNIGEFAFSNLSNLASLTLQCSGNIGRSAFESCTSLQDTLTIPAGVTGIGDQTFRGCTGLTSVDFTAYTGSTIGPHAFRDCSNITSLTFDNAVAPAVGASAFTDVAPVGKLYYPSNGTGYDAILTKLPIGWRLSFTGSPMVGAIMTDTQGITYVITKATVPYEAKVQGGIGNPNNSVTVNNPVIYDTITFESNKYAVTGIQDDAFRDNISLTGKLSINSSDSIGQRAFRGCSGLSDTLDIPSSITDIGHYAFDDCSGLTALTLNNSGRIGNYAFENCISLGDTLVIPSSITDVGLYAFFACRLLTSLTLDNNGIIGYYAFENCTGLSGELVIPANVTDVGNYAFHNTGLTGLAVSNSGAIGHYAFSECKFLASVDFSEYAETGSIGDYAFNDCSVLDSLVFGSATAPTASPNAFTGVAEVGTLYYPTGATGYNTLLTYLPAGWSAITIVGTPTVGVSTLSVRAAAGGLRIAGLAGGETLTLYNMHGRLIYTGKTASGEQLVQLREHGIYIVVAGKQVIKAIY